jgi:hypothetical protein
MHTITITIVANRAPPRRTSESAGSADGAQRGDEPAVVAAEQERPPVERPSCSRKSHVQSRR